MMSYNIHDTNTEKINVVSASPISRAIRNLYKVVKWCNSSSVSELAQSKLADGKIILILLLIAQKFLSATSKADLKFWR